MASGVVKVGQRTYAVGLFWQPSPSGRVAQAAREAALQPGQKADFYCVRAASKSVAVPQYGLGQDNQGHKVGMPTLAASLANVQPGSWAGAFRLREGTWVIVVRDDLVAPDGDTLFESDEAARERLLQEISLGGVQRIYSPDGWAIPGSDPTPLPLLLQDRADCRLQPVHLPVRLMLYAGGAVAAVALLVFFGLQYQSEQERMELERIAQQRAKEGAISGMMQEWKWPPPEETYAKIWEKKPWIRDSLESCQKMFAQLAASQFGWKRRETVCQEGSLTVHWTRDQGHIAVPMDRAIINEPVILALESAHDKLVPRGTEALLDEKAVTHLALASAWPFMLQRLPDDPPAVKPPPEVKKPPPPPPPPWRKRGVKYNGKVPPWEMQDYFKDVPGMFINKITWDGANWFWEAIIYEKRGG
ncbi:MAG: type 4b pilus protein PilO2 [Proteobacteria bacterium]|nr:type 4b pilus protein PilO2 [Pseudomonadota bacterium]